VIIYVCDYGEKSNQSAKMSVLKEAQQLSNSDYFEQLWQLDTDWFEPPNHRRGGWSGVVKYVLKTANGAVDVFIKRQENHRTKTWCHPLKGIHTFQKEYNNILRLTAKHIPTLETVYFSCDKSRAILVTKELTGYQSLENISPLSLSSVSRKQLLKAVARVLADMHQAHFQHNSLYPKHIFVKPINNGWDIKIIDLEKMKRTLFVRQSMMRDLGTLERHANQDWSIKDRVFFLQQYFNEQPLSKKTRQLLHKIVKPKKAKRH
jgi:tRNA A-37 threonylcarbamoyl transferase component Bud32